MSRSSAILVTIEHFWLQLSNFRQSHAQPSFNSASAMQRFFQSSIENKYALNMPQNNSRIVGTYYFSDDLDAGVIVSELRIRE